ncbi:hypothetical protein Back11_56850 [Paenibacillus baekrokdamisoli]|uniref:Uncharacterized protein n=1 Tax=Paenibacillus baekrokdamisoli TaxID=1712516 RepID=A0A3G9IZL9_9BACL|nr:hypothetical protein Back11_56850 [Paenibacillus baekrokdamisoli]
MIYMNCPVTAITPIGLFQIQGSNIIGVTSKDFWRDIVIQKDKLRNVLNSMKSTS